MILSFMPPQTLGQFEKLLVMWPGGGLGVASLWFRSAVFVSLYTKFMWKRALKRMGHSNMVAELLRLVFVPNPHHRDTSSEDCKHANISADSVCK